MPTQQTFTSPGSTTFTVPSDVTSMLVEAWGAAGGDATVDVTASGGLGGKAEGVISVTAGEDLEIVVGAVGADSSTTNTAGGGEASDVRQSGTTLSDRVIVGGGGGGAADGTRTQDNVGGGDGGASTGQDGDDSGFPSGATGVNLNGGGGGSQTAGGTAGGQGGGDGSFGVGGAGDTDDATPGGGDGGDGYYGGAGGAQATDDDFGDDYAAAGGGGSNFVTSAASETQSTRGVQSGDGEVALTYAEEPSVTIDSLTETGEAAVRIQASNANTYDSTGDWAVYRSVDGSQGTQIHTESTNADLDYTDTNAPTGDVVFYTVERVNDFGSDSAQQSRIVRAAAVTNLAVTAHDGTSVDLGWGDNPGPDIDQYEIYRAETSGGAFADYTQIDTSPSSSYSDTGLENGERYYYTILATNASDASYDSRYPGEVDQITDLPAPTIDSLEDTA